MDTLGLMPDPSRGGLRLARLSAFVAACLGLGAAGHALGGGGVPVAGALLVTLPVLGLLGLWFSRRERGIAALFGLLAAVELGLHVLFHMAAAPAPALDPALLARAGHRHGAPLATSHAEMIHGVAHGGSVHELLPTGPMAVAHLLAAAGTAVALGWGERSLWALARRLLPALPEPPRAAIAHEALIPSPAPAPLRAVDLVRLAPVRGPPVAQPA